MKFVTLAAFSAGGAFGPELHGYVSGAGMAPKVRMT